MLANTKLRTKLVAVAIPPMLILAIVAGYGAFVTFTSDSMSADELQSDLRIISILAVVGIISSILAVFAMRDRIMAPILEVTEGARELAENRLPVLIEGLRNPNAEIPEFDPIAFDQTDELGDLAAALNSVQETAGEISAEQKNIFKRGISDLVVNLARRNQSLLDRQIESIDRLEADEEDPDRLEQLFSLDHLATRMRRNAESLLVLAGSEPARRRGGPVAIADVLRVAMSEIEDYRKVQLSNMEHEEIGAQSAVDLAHLMSELMENATQFSPPDAVVEVKGAVDESGSYVIGIIDRGIGMNDEQLLAANDLLRNPPDLGITLTRSLGFLVVGQLSKRLGVGVELVKTPGSGTTAIVVVPASLLASAPRQSVQSPLADSAPAASLPASLAAPPAPTPTPEAAPVVEAPAQWEQPAPPFDGPAIVSDEAPAPLRQPEVPQGWEQPAPPAPAFEAPVYEAPAPQFEAPAYEAPAPQFEAPVYEAPAPQFEAPAPQFEAPAYETPAPAFEAPVYEAPPAPAQPEAPEGWGQPEVPQAWEQPAPAPAPAPAFEAPVYEAPTPEFEAPAYEAPAPAFEAPTFDEPAFEAPAFEAPAEQAPAGWPSGPSEVSAPSADYIPGWDDPIDEPMAPATAHQPPHTDPLAAAFQTPVPGQMPPVSRLDEAIPTGDQFETGVSELLQEPQPQTSAGLVRRDRNTSQAPTSEGRPVAASVRSPDEVRNMLARYRSGLKGNPGNGEQQ